MCVFHQESYIKLLKLLITSISEKGNINKTTDILIITSPVFQPLIQKELEGFSLPIQYYILNLQTLMEASCCKLKIFQYSEIDKYEKILYLDTDVLVNSDVNPLFDTHISSEKLYALEEGITGHVSEKYSK
jgi:lipopolysaccharide biosynthesis glycosyltransferase